MDAVVVQASDQLAVKEMPVSSLSFPCDVCGRVFVHPANLSRHKKLHSSDKPFVCDVCGKAFNRSDTLKSHKASHSDEEKLPCNRCGKIFKSKNLLKSHQINKHGAKICLYELHQNKHRSAKRKQQHKSMLCDICGSSFVDDKRLKNHLKMHNSPFKYTCHLCNRTFKQQSTLLIHLRQHLGDSDFVCEQCNKAFQSAASLKWHRKRHVRQLPSACPICHRMFADEHLLKMHLKIHDEEKAFKCPHCDKTFTHSSTLKHHVRIHTGFKPYVCDICDHAFAQLASLKYHKRTHNGEKPYSCHICGKSYTRNSTLSIHLTRHTGQKRISCPQLCDFKCDTLKKLRKHLENQHPELKDVIDAVLKQCRGRVSGALYADSPGLIYGTDASAIQHIPGSENTYCLQQAQDMDTNVVFANIEQAADQGNASGEKLYELTFSYMDPQDNNEVHTYEIVYPSQGLDSEGVTHASTTYNPALSQVYSCNSMNSIVIDSGLDALKNHVTIQNFPGDSNTVELQIEEITGGGEDYGDAQIVVIDIEPCEDPCTDAGSRSGIICDEGKHEIMGEVTKLEIIDRETGKPDILSLLRRAETIDNNEPDYESNDEDEIIVVDEESLEGSAPAGETEEGKSLDEEAQEEEAQEEEAQEEEAQEEDARVPQKLPEEKPPVKHEPSKNADKQPVAIPSPSFNMRLRDRSILKRSFVLKKGTRKRKIPVLEAKHPDDKAKIISEKKHKVTSPDSKENVCKLKNKPAPKLNKTETVIKPKGDVHSEKKIGTKKPKKEKIEIDEGEQLSGGETESNKPQQKSKMKKDQKESRLSNKRKKDSAESGHKNERKKKRDEGGPTDKVKSPDKGSNGVFKVEPVECGLCDLMFSCTKDLLAHECLPAGERFYSCSVCERKFTHPDHLMLHQVTHKGTNSFLCSHCGGIFSSLDQLTGHIADNHDSMHPFVCNACEFSCVHLGELKQHMKSHEVKDVMFCEVCSLRLESAKDYKSHMSTHEMERPFKCNLCDKTFKVSSCLKLHVRKKHTGEKFFKCGICQEAFVAASKLERHMRSHSGVLPFTCDYCGKMFIDSRLLKTHVITHKDDRPHACDHCGMGFKHKSTLNAHIRTHTGTKPYACPICNVSFAQRSSLAYHQRIHDGVKPYVCHICGSSYTRNTTLNMHMSVHTGIKRLSCPHCAFKCNRQKGLRNHIEKEHNKASATQTFTVEIPILTEQQLQGHIEVTSMLEQDYKHETCGEEELRLEQQKEPDVLDEALEEHIIMLPSSLSVAESLLQLQQQCHPTQKLHIEFA